MATIGDLEREAGIGPTSQERAAFWRQFHHLEGKACLDAGVAELKRLIAAKVARTDGVPETRRRLPKRDRLPPLTPGAADGAAGLCRKTRPALEERSEQCLDGRRAP
ncbi:hypothetical protein [Sinorhizobium sp. BJ1]|uniref:hypothetical protein n=1 Tax=Sinorhizobium sp. BJ1 TaxID=2035455 RepID=UPI001FE094BE|nr:hypothetical protein [Sinorhizobium sp. BJ1]